MRLLQTETLEIREFIGSQIPPYAILSHRWGDGEVTYQDMRHGLRGVVEKKVGFGKTQNCCEQAATDGLAYAWVDTCCIDKSSSMELSEAINSMYQWYQMAAVCYVYLSDVIHPVAEESYNADNSMVLENLFNVEQFLASKCQFTRDHRHIGPLGYSRPDSLSRARADTIFLRQKPKHSVRSLAEKVVRFRNGHKIGRQQGFYDPYLVPALFATSVVDDDWITHLLPPDCHSGALIFPFRPDRQYDLIILYRYNTGSKKWSYDVVCAVPEVKVIDTYAAPFHDAKEHGQCIYESRLDLKYPYGETMTYFNGKNKSIDDLQKEFTPLDSLSSPTQLPLNRSLMVENRTEFFHDQVTPILSIDLSSDHKWLTATYKKRRQLFEESGSFTSSFYKYFAS
jgi:hypothetical protein